jgi:hypothetical protein
MNSIFTTMDLFNVCGLVPIFNGMLPTYASLQRAHKLYMSGLSSLPLPACPGVEPIPSSSVIDKIL